MPAGTDTAGLPTTLKSAVRAALFSTPTCSSPTIVFTLTSAGNATSGLVAETTKSTCSKRSATASSATIRCSSTRAAIRRS